MEKMWLKGTTVPFTSDQMQFIITVPIFFCSPPLMLNSSLLLLLAYFGAKSPAMDGTNPCHTESTLCPLSETGLLCLSLLVGSSQNICHFHTVTKSSVHSPVIITFQGFSGITDINYLINC